MSLFKKKTGAEPEIRTESGSGRSKVAQLVLLLLIAVFGYLYFFTSLIVPHEGAKPEQSAAPASTPQVTQSMPPRPADTAAPPTAAAPAAPAAPGVPAAPPAPAAPAPTAAPAGGQKPAVATPAPAAPPQATAPSKAPAVPSAKKEAVKPSKPAEQKQAASVPKKEEAKPAKGPDAAAKDKQPAKAAPQAVKKEQKPAPAGEKAKADAGSYTILVGEFAAADVAAVEAKLNKHKLKPVRSVTRKNQQMTRLYYGVYSDYDSYSAALEKLKQSAKSSFAIEKDGRYSVYAGSFGSADRAAAEKKRLADKGIKVELQQISLPQSTVRLSAGPFSGKAAADKAAARLKKEGLAVKVSLKGK